MNTYKTNAIISGVLFITATGAAIVSGFFLLPILQTSDYLTQVSANEVQVALGAFNSSGIASESVKIDTH